MWIILIVAISCLMYVVISAADRQARRDYIPMSEIMQMKAQPDKYVPWSYEKRMRYYNRDRQMHAHYVEPRRTYVSYIETGHISRRS